MPRRAEPAEAGGPQKPGRTTGPRTQRKRTPKPAAAATTTGPVETAARQLAEALATAGHTSASIQLQAALLCANAAALDAALTAANFYGVRQSTLGVAEAITRIQDATADHDDPQLKALLSSLATPTLMPTQ